MRMGKFSKYGNKMAERAQAKMLKAAEKSFKRIFSRMDIDKQCKVTMKYIRWMGRDVVRQNLLAEHAFPQDIRDKQEETGWTDQQLVDYYWNFERFPKMWDALGYDKDYFETVVAMATAE